MKTISPPIGMLVPSPTDDVKTQIGDQNADDLSDLSEAGSDNDEEDENAIRSSIDLPHVLVESKTKIGGKNELNSFDHELLEPASLVSESSLMRQSPLISEAKNELLLLGGYEEDEATLLPVSDRNGHAILANGNTNGYSRSRGFSDAEILGITISEKFEPVPAPR